MIINQATTIRTEDGGHHTKVYCSNQDNKELHLKKNNKCCTKYW